MEDVSSMNTSQSRRLTCDHSFHISCLLNWYKESDQCPICRTPQTDDLFIEFRNKIEEEMRVKYMDAIKSLEAELAECRLHF